MKKIDELKAEIEKAEKNLDRLKTYLSNKKEELERIDAIEEGNYVRVKIDPVEFIGRFDGIVNGTPKINSFKSFSGEVIGVVKKWQPKKGDLCIFWDKDRFIKYSIIDVFNHKSNGLFQTKSRVTWANCIPFISEKQFKEHTGYEEC